MPEREQLAAMASHGASMAIFLSSGMLPEVARQLLAGGAYTADTPAVLVYKATWPEERICRCTIGTLAQSGEEAGIHSTALVLVGEFLRQGNAHYDRSKLYDPGFTTGFREATR